MCGLGDAGELKAGLLVTAEVGEFASVTEIKMITEHRDEGKSRRLTQLAQCVAYVSLRSLATA